MLSSQQYLKVINLTCVINKTDQQQQPILEFCMQPFVLPTSLSVHSCNSLKAVQSLHYCRGGGAQSSPQTTTFLKYGLTACAWVS